jgi:hypothetical protein
MGLENLPLQCIPLYLLHYAEDCTNRRGNMTGWWLEKFRVRYGDCSITKLAGAPFLAFFATSGTAKLIRIIKPPGPSSQYNQIFCPA